MSFDLTKNLQKNDVTFNFGDVKVIDLLKTPESFLNPETIFNSSLYIVVRSMSKTKIVETFFNETVMHWGLLFELKDIRTNLSKEFILCELTYNKEKIITYNIGRIPYHSLSTMNEYLIYKLDFDFRLKYKEIISVCVNHTFNNKKYNINGGIHCQSWCLEIITKIVKAKIQSSSPGKDIINEIKDHFQICSDNFLIRRYIEKQETGKK